MGFVTISSIPGKKTEFTCCLGIGIHPSSPTSSLIHYRLNFIARFQVVRLNPYPEFGQRYYSIEFSIELICSKVVKSQRYYCLKLKMDPMMWMKSQATRCSVMNIRSCKDSNEFMKDELLDSRRVVNCVWLKEGILRCLGIFVKADRF